MPLRALAEALDYVIRGVLDRKGDRHKVLNLLRFGTLITWSRFGCARDVPGCHMVGHPQRVRCPLARGPRSLLYGTVAFVIDVFARRIVGWQASRRAHASFILDALEQALHDRCLRSWSWPRAPFGSRRSIRVHSAFRAVGRSWHRAVCWKRRRQLRERPRRNDQRTLQDKLKRNGLQKTRGGSRGLV